MPVAIHEETEERGGEHRIIACDHTVGKWWDLE